MNGSKKSIREDYLNPGAPLGKFYSYNPNQPEFEEIIQNKSAYPFDRETLVEVITEQYQGLTLFKETQQALSHLAQPNCYTVTTGHQLVFLGGPMFTTYKVLHTIKLAEELAQRHPQHQFVPIFWIHTEDHDYEEINHYFPSYQEKRVYEGKFEGKVGNHIIGKEISSLLPSSFPDELKASYQPGMTWAQAYRAYMHQLFGPLGVLMLDADDPRLKKQFIHTFQQDLVENLGQHCVETSSARLEEMGYSPQVSPREINIFYVEGNYRNRIVREDSYFRALDTPLKWTQNEMLNLLNQHPEYFSPNVCLRPLYQETILPNLAYIGGWGELSYWLQLKGLFDTAGVHFPLLLPRMSATILRKKEASQWLAKGLKLSDINFPLGDIQRKLTPNYWNEQDLQQHIKELEQQYQGLKTYIQTFSSTLPLSVESQLSKNRKFFTRLKKKVEKVIIQTHSEFKEVAVLKEAIQPDRMKQERILSLAAFPESSPQELISQLYEHCQPLNYSPSFFTLSS